MLLPKKITNQSQINFVHVSSPALSSDLKLFNKLVTNLIKEYPLTKVLEVERKGLDPRYLAASENERLKQLRKAIKDADWLCPVYGGSGCADVVRYMTDEDLAKIRKNRPVVNGFSDSTFLINFLYFKLKLQTFHYSNACGLSLHKNKKQFFDIITGKIDRYSYLQKNYHWLNPNQGPSAKIEGIAIGGNLTTFRELLDICDIRPRSWEDYILFIEDLDIDMEDLHRIIIALDERGIFMHIKALVIGRMDEKSFEQTWAKLNYIFGDKHKTDHVFEYLISDVIEERIEDRDPLYMLKVDNFGHGVYNEHMIVPIGAKTIIHPSGEIEFVGPFVEDEVATDQQMATDTTDLVH